MKVPLRARDWSGQQGASPDALVAFRRCIPIELPDDYFQLLSDTDGGEGPLPIQPCYCILDDIATMKANLAEAWHRTWLNEGLFVIGGNGGGELIALDLRSQGVTSVIAVDMVAGVDSVLLIASSLSEFAEMLGCDA